MWEWLGAPLFDGRAHLISQEQMWHARMMFIAWGVLSPLSIVMARFFKVLPWQDWPRELDSKVWWRFHWLAQSVVLILTIAGSLLMYRATDDRTHLHGWLGYAILSLVLVQVLLGYFRGSKGGPTDPQTNGDLHGDHYSMTPRRRLFESLHKTLGYLLLSIAAVAVLFGMQIVNAPRWMWLSILVWWLVLFIAFVILQKHGRAIDTYQAIWGPESRHPGNAKDAAGWGMRRADRHGRF